MAKTEKLELQPIEKGELQYYPDEQRSHAVGNPVPENNSQSDQMLQMIKQLAQVPDFDTQKLQQIIDMRNAENTEQARILFNRKMAVVQNLIRPVVKDGDNKQTKSKYARLDSVIKEISPIYTANGFALSFSQGKVDSEKLREAGFTRTLLEVSHDGGYSKEFYVDFPPDATGIQGAVNKTAIHAAKSTISYARNTLICMAFNVALADDDDDGQAAGQLPPEQEFITDDQVKELVDLYTKLGWTDEEFLKLSRTETVSEILADRFNAAKNTLVKRLEAKEKALEN